MSLFVDEDGYMRGWLAALLCCWAAMGEDEYNCEKKDTKAKLSRPSIHNEQPTQLEMMSPPRDRQLAAFKHAGFTEEDRVRPITERPPSINPLDFGESSLMGKMSLHNRRKSSTTLLNFHKSAKRHSSKSVLRMSIGQPTNFRKLDYTEKQRRSLKPLQLEPVVLRGGEPDVIPSGDDQLVRHNNNKSLDIDYCLATAARRSSYRESRETPFQRCQQMSAVAKQDTFATNGKDEKSTCNDTSRSIHPTLSTKSSSSSMYSLRRQALETSASSTSQSSRSSGERTRLKRKRSNQANRMPSVGSNDLDKEILELNTIVEERRAESARPLSPEDTHVPAVAPLMAVRARSETLTDIGSAFSRPLRLDTDCPTISEAVSPTPIKSPVRSRLSRPFTNMPDTNLTTEAVGVVRRPSSRVTGWLSNLLSASSTIPEDNATQNQQQTSNCTPPPVAVRRRAVSETSLCTTVTELESTTAPSTTSSPHSSSHKSHHSRSITGESSSTRLMTPISEPQSADCTSEYLERKDSSRKITVGTSQHWPSTTMDHPNPSQVGLAL